MVQFFVRPPFFYTFLTMSLVFMLSEFVDYTEFYEVLGILPH